MVEFLPVCEPAGRGPVPRGRLCRNGAGLSSCDQRAVWAAYRRACALRLLEYPAWSHQSLACPSACSHPRGSDSDSSVALFHKPKGAWMVPLVSDRAGMGCHYGRGPHVRLRPLAVGYHVHSTLLLHLHDPSCTACETPIQVSNNVLHSFLVLAPDLVVQI